MHDAVVTQIIACIALLCVHPHRTRSPLTACLLARRLLSGTKGPQKARKGREGEEREEEEDEERRRERSRELLPRCTHRCLRLSSMELSVVEGFHEVESHAASRVNSQYTPHKHTDMPK